MKELLTIQTNLKAPKDKRNNFGGYSYRNAEQIFEAVKPLLAQTECTLSVSDSIELIGDRFYIKSTAILTNKDGEKETVSAYAREPLSRKGMDDAQVTGSTSSYARKFALGGLFCIDDSSLDPDATNTHGKDEQKSVPERKDCPGAIYWKLIKMDVEGVKDKKGRTGLEYYKANYNPSEEELKKFDSDLQMARDARETQDFLDLDESAQNPKNKK